MINTRNELSLLSSAIDDARAAMNAGDDKKLRTALYQARAFTSRLQSEPKQPDFVVKATDPNAPATILFWISKAYEGEVAIEKRKQAMEHYDRIVAWQEENPDLVKQPD